MQKIYPIYKDPDPEHAIDFDAQFYMPAKHFLNQDIDTFYFNTACNLVDDSCVAIALYFDMLRKIIDGIGNLSNPLYREINQQMFFVLSKTLNFLLLPLTMVIIFFILSRYSQEAALEKAIFLGRIYTSAFFFQ